MSSTRRRHGPGISIPSRNPTRSAKALAARVSTMERPLHPPSASDQSDVPPPGAADPKAKVLQEEDRGTAFSPRGTLSW